MKVILQTLCGCEKILDILEPLPWRINLPLEPAGYTFDNPSEGLDTFQGIPCREFVQHSQYQGRVVYREKEIRVCKRPDPPQLTNKEYSLAVANFTDFIMRGPYANDWNKVQNDFILRHDGARLVMHADSKILMGAWYPSPAWENSEEAIHIFSALRKILS